MVRSLVCCKKIPINDRVILDTAWSFKFLFIWMQILGIGLDPPNFPNCRIIHVYGFIIMLACVLSNVKVATNIVWKLSLPLTHPNAFSMRTTATNNWSIGIDYINHCFLMSGVCPTVFYVARTRWKRLWSIVEAFESTSCYKFNYKRLRKQLFVALTPVLMVCLCPFLVYRNECTNLYYYIRK